MTDLLSRLRDVDTTRRIGESYADTHERRQRDRDEAAARIEQLEAALLTGVCMLSEMGLDPREKCQMAYDYMSAALEKRT